MDNHTATATKQNSSAFQTTTVDDPLLKCLILLAKYYQQPCSEQALTQGLPLENHHLTPNLFVRAAERANLTANTCKTELLNVHPLALPVVLLLKNNQACILIKIDSKAHIMLPDTGEGISQVNIAELSSQYIGECIFVKPKYNFSTRAEETFKKPLKNWFWGVMLKSWPIYSEVLLASGLINLFALAIPLFVMNVYDRVVPNHAIETMWVLASGVAIAFMFDFLLKNLRAYFIDMAGKKVDMELSANIFEHVLGIKMSHRPTSVGSFINTIQSFEMFREFITSTTITVLVDLPFLFLYLFVIYLVGGNLFWIPLAMVPIVITVGLILQLPLTRLTKESYKHAAEKQATLIESLAGVEAIKSVRAEGVLQRRWEQVIALSAAISAKLRLVSNGAIHFSTFAQQSASVLVVIFGVYKISEGEITTGALIACTILTGRALAPLSQIAGLLSRYYQSVNALTSLNEVMKLPVERPEDRKHLHRPHLSGDIEFKHVKFAYPNTEVGTLNDISFKIKSGEKVAIIGRLGSGKSTIAKMLAGMYNPSEGNILLDGTDYQQIDPADLRHNLAYVPQDVVLFYGSVKHNISIGSPHIDDAQILKAAKLSGTDEFVRKHPHGYDLQVGERGCQLSRGQRQSIALARALLLEPSILLLDEPSNSLDDASEALLRINLKRFVRETQKTMLLITHKASMLEIVDRIIVVDNGRIIADGPKESVLTALKQGSLKTTQVRK